MATTGTAPSHAPGAHSLGRFLVAAMAAGGWIAAVAAADEPARLHRYTVAVDEALSAIRVRACFAGKPPRHLMAESLDASGALEKVELEGARKRFEPNGTELRLGTLPDGACIAYVVNLAQFRGRHERGGSPTRQVGDDLLTDLGMWFWRPDPLPPEEDIEVSFDLPPGMSASAPWRPVEAPDGRRYRVGHTPYDWPAAVAFGHFTEQIVEAAGARLRLVVLEGRPKIDPALIAEWLRHAATTVATLYGRFPVPSAQIVVVPNARGDEPVPWAYVLRGGGPSAHFFINQRRSLEEFNRDWTVVHELAHLVLPYVQSEDAWLSEGTASYYQNVLLARSGAIDARQAWQRMYAAFQRSMKTMPGITLTEATERMYRGGSYMRVYWEGAAIMLLADQRLRSRSDGRQSLDTALEQFQRCCLLAESGWRARDVFGKLDELTATTVFSELYDQHVGSEQFPDVDQAYRLLGVEVSASGEVVLRDDAPQREYRDAIMFKSAMLNGGMLKKGLFENRVLETGRSETGKLETRMAAPAGGFVATAGKDTARAATSPH
jgi:M61 glycyl aminopeptidase